MTATERYAVVHERTLAHEEVIKAALRVLTSEREDPGYAHLDAEQQYAVEMLALAARRLTRATDALPDDEKPVDWNKADEPERKPVELELCSECGEEIPEGRLFITPFGARMHVWCATDDGED